MAVALALPAARPTNETPPARRRPNVIVYLVDTLRSDRLGCYGYTRPTSPHIDAFARDGIVFRSAVAPSSWTKPAVASIFTALQPWTHGANDWSHRLGATLPTLPQVLHDTGYQTAAFVTSAVVRSAYGFDRGFELFDQRLKETIEPDRPTSEWVSDRALEWLDARGDPRPFFLYLHTLDPHAPYDPPPPHRERLAGGVDAGLGSIASLKALVARGGEVPAEVRDGLSALYDAEVAGNDASFGRLVAGLRQRGVYDGALIVLLSDHGEAFHEHGSWMHGTTLYEELLRVPLLLKLPGSAAAGSQVVESVQLVDVLPTILAVLGEPLTAGAQGRSLLPMLVGGRGRGTPRAKLASLDFDGRRIDSLAVDGLKLIRHAPDRLELFDLRADPAEARDLAAAQPKTRARLLRALRASRAAAPAPAAADEAPMDAARLEQLRAMGYLH